MRSFQVTLAFGLLVLSYQSALSQSTFEGVGNRIMKDAPTVRGPTIDTRVAPTTSPNTQISCAKTYNTFSKREVYEDLRASDALCGKSPIVSAAPSAPVKLNKGLVDDAKRGGTGLNINSKPIVKPAASKQVPVRSTSTFQSPPLAKPVAISTEEAAALGSQRYQECTDSWKGFTDAGIATADVKYLCDEYRKNGDRSLVNPNPRFKGLTVEQATAQGFRFPHTQPHSPRSSPGINCVQLQSQFRQAVSNTGFGIDPRLHSTAQQLDQHCGGAR